jgi:glutaredoxin 3
LYCDSILKLNPRSTPVGFSIILESPIKTKHPKTQVIYDISMVEILTKVEIYTSSYCGYCNAAKGILENKGVKFVEIDLSDNYELRIKLHEKHNWRTVPIIVINDSLVGGYHNLVALDRKGELDRLLEVEFED